MSPFDYVVFAAIFIAIAMIGFMSNKSVTSTDDFFTASHRLGKIEAGFSMAATEFGGGSLVGSIGLVYAIGVGGIMYSWSVVPPLFLMMWLTAGKLNAEKLTTVTEFLGKKYGLRAQLLSSILHLLASIATLSIQFYLCALTLHLMTGINTTLAFWLAFLFTLAYSVAGGLIAVVRTDVFQFIVIVTCFIILTIVAVHNVGGVSEIAHANLPDSFFNWGEMGMTDTLGWMLWALFTYSTTQDYIQRLFAAKDVSTARFSYGCLGFTFIVAGILSVLVGMAGAILMPGIEDTDSVYLAMALEYLPVGLRGLAAAGIFAATMSTADSGMIACATLFVTDIYKPFIWKKDSDEKLLWTSRIATVIIASGCAIMGTFVTSILDMLYYGGLFYSCAVFVPLIVALWSKKDLVPAAGFYAIIAGVAGGCISEFYLLRHFTGGIALIPSNAFGAICSLIVFVVITFIVRQKEKKAQTSEV